ncbi:hypothetical protein HDV01_002734 [Terramyces sp. JEL0728]|nr:hypothetical protein HDV01_002734 [Terramyces sp. JEL0728]
MLRIHSVIMKSSVLSTLFLAYKVAALDITDLLEFDRPLLEILDTQMAHSFKCRLKQKPEEAVQVYFEGTGINFENCNYNFPVDSYDQWQTININNVPVFEKLSDVDFQIKARCFHKGDQGDHHLPCHRKPTCGGTCQSHGDPHFVDFQGYSFTHQAEGTFSLFEHEHLAVQAIQGPCNFDVWPKNVMCNQAVAIRYGSTILALDVREKHQKAYGMKYVSKNTDGVQYKAPSKQDSTHNVKLPCGSSIELIVSQNSKETWIDVNLHIAPGYGDNGGVCNKLGTDDDNMYGKDKTYQKNNIDGYVWSWKVDDSNNLFNGQCKPSTPPVTYPPQTCTCPDTPVPENPPVVPQLPPYTQYIPPPAQTTTVLTTTVVQTTTIPATTVPATTNPATSDIPKTVATTGYGNTQTDVPNTTPVTSDIALTVPATTTTIPAVVVVQTTTVVVTSTVDVTPPQPTATMPANPYYNDQINSYCSNLFNIPGCSSISNTTNYVTACVADALSSGSLQFSEASKLAYLAQCKTSTNYMINYPAPQVQQQGHDIQKTCGLGNNTCANNCGGQGVCGANGCRCNPGYGGLDCSTDLTKMISYNPQTGSYSDQTPSNVYPVQVVNSPTASNTTGAYESQDSPSGAGNEGYGNAVTSAVAVPVNTGAAPIISSAFAAQVSSAFIALAIALAM